MTDKAYNEAHDVLSRAAWRYIGTDYWIDPQTDTKLTTSVAIKVLRQREKREKILKGIKTPRPKLLLCSDWEGIRKELQKQLKPFGLTVKTKGNYKEWGDQLQWTVEKLPNPVWEAHMRKLNRAGIDPWNNYT